MALKTFPGRGLFCRLRGEDKAVTVGATCRAKQVKGAAGAEKLEVVTIYAKLNPQQQMVVFQSSPRGTRKARLLCL